MFSRVTHDHLRPPCTPSRKGHRAIALTAKAPATDLRAAGMAALATVLSLAAVAALAAKLVISL